MLKRFFPTLLGVLLYSCDYLLAQNETTHPMPPPIEEIKDEPIKFVGDEISDKRYYDGRLRYAIGVHNYQAMRANRTQPPEASDDVVGWTYSHQPYLAYWNGRFYLQYLSNVHSEHIPPGRTLMMTSDDGFHWSPPKVAFPKYSLPEIDRYFESIGEVDLPAGTFGVMHQRMGFYVAPNDRLLTLAFYSFSPPPAYPSPNDGQGLGRVVREVYKDGTLGPVYFIRYNRAAGWNENNTKYPFYTASDDKGFIEACDSLLADKLVTLQWQEEDMPDPGFYNFDAGETFSSFTWTRRPDGTLLGVMKDNIASLSPDNGMTWTEPGRIRTFRTTSAKIWVEKTADDRYALVYNHSGSRSNRFPMVVLTSTDAYRFDNPLLLNGEVPPMRYMGFEKNTGSQYFRGIAPGNGDPPGDYMWNTYSMNKEDIWVSRTPVPIRGSVEKHVSQDFQNLDDTVSNLVMWNLYVPKWAPVTIDNDPVEFGNKVLRLTDEDPYDYAIAQRAFPESRQVNIEFDIYVEKAGKSYLFVEVQDKHGYRPNSLRFDGVRVGMDRGATEPDPVLYKSGKWMNVRMELDVGKQMYSLYLDGEKIYDLRFDEKVEYLERIVFRTGPWRGDVRQFIIDGEPGAKGIYKEDLPGADQAVSESVFLIDNVKTY